MPLQTRKNMRVRHIRLRWPNEAVHSDLTILLYNSLHNDNEAALMHYEHTYHAL